MDYAIYFASVVLSFIAGLFIKSFFPSYFSEKGKNLATKEDINEITKIVEQIKTDFSKDLEFLKWNLGKKATIHKLIAEKEIAGISEIGNLLLELKIATFHLRPATDYLPSDQAKKTEEFQRRLDAWVEKHNLFSMSIDRHRLFIPQGLYDIFHHIRQLSVNEANNFRIDLRRRNSEFDFEKSSQNIDQLLDTINATVKIIQHRFEIEGLNLKTAKTEKISALKK